MTLLEKYGVQEEELSVNIPWCMLCFISVSQLVPDFAHQQTALDLHSTQSLRGLLQYLGLGISTYTPENQHETHVNWWFGVDVSPFPRGYYFQVPCVCFRKWWYPQNTSKWSFLVGKPMVVGETHHCRKPPCVFFGGCRPLFATIASSIRTSNKPCLRTISWTRP